MRFVFLHSYDRAEKNCYGFAPDCLQWLKSTLCKTPDAYHILVFSHLTPMVGLQCWTDYIRGGDELVGYLEQYNAKAPDRPDRRVLAYINGHNHADQVFTDLSFPIISIGCSKAEYFAEHKPEGSHTPMRRLGEASQELWDALIVNTKEKKLDFLRFGAGCDRSVHIT